MATKLGAFKKDGTVQCVKLVEENNIERENWEGTLASTGGGDIVIHNGYKISLTIPGDKNASSFQNNDFIKIGATSVNDSNTLITIYINKASGAAVKSYITVSDEFYTLPKDSPRMKNIIFYRGAAQIPYQGTSQDKISIYDRSNNLVGDYFYSDLGQFSSDTPSGKLWEIPELEKQHPISKINGFKGENLGNTNSFTLDNGWTFSATLDGAPVGGITVGTGVFNFIPENSENSFFELSMGGYKGTSIIKDFSTWFNNSEIKVPSIDCYFSTLFWNRTGRLVFTITDNKNKSTQFYADLATGSNVSFTLNPVNSEDYLSFPPEIRMKNSSVKITKNGFLKCQKLIEEEVVDNIDSFAPLQTSSSGSHTFILKNGTYIDLYENDTLVNVTTLGGIDCFQSGTPVLSISFNPNQIGHTNSNSQTEWDYNGPVSIVRVTVHFSNPTNYTNVNKCVITSNNKTATFTGSASTGTFLGNLSDTSDSWNIPYSERFKIPTVRVYKDGTIKCAKLQEATLLPAAWGTPTKVGAYAQYNFPNGYQINIKSIADNSLCTTGTTDASKYRLNYIYNDGGTVSNLMIFSINEIETTPAFYSSNSYINSASSEYNFGAYTQGVYLEILDPNKKQLGRLSSTNMDLSTSFGIVNSEDKEITIPLLDRNTPSWN